MVSDPICDVVSDPICDEKTTTDLERAGWTVMRFWEHEVEGNATACALKIADALEKSRADKDRE